METEAEVLQMFMGTGGRLGTSVCVCVSFLRPGHGLRWLLGSGHIHGTAEGGYALQLGEGEACSALSDGLKGQLIHLFCEKHS